MNVAEVNLRELRTIVRRCLDEHELKNDIRLKKVGFSDLARVTARVVVIKDWNAEQDGHKWNSLVRMIFARTSKLYADLLGWTLFVEAE